MNILNFDNGMAAYNYKYVFVKLLTTVVLLATACNASQNGEGHDDTGRNTVNESIRNNISEKKEYFAKHWATINDLDYFNNSYVTNKENLHHIDGTHDLSMLCIDKPLDQFIHELRQGEYIEDNTKYIQLVGEVEAFANHYYGCLIQTSEPQTFEAIVFSYAIFNPNSAKGIFCVSAWSENLANKDKLKDFALEAIKHIKVLNKYEFEQALQDEKNKYLAEREQMKQKMDANEIWWNNTLANKKLYLLETESASGVTSTTKRYYFLCADGQFQFYDVHNMYSHGASWGDGSQRSAAFDNEVGTKTKSGYYLVTKTETGWLKLLFDFEDKTHTYFLEGFSDEGDLVFRFPNNRKSAFSVSTYVCN